MYQRPEPLRATNNPPKTKKSPDRCQSGDEVGDNHKPPEEKQMSNFADWPQANWQLLAHLPGLSVH